MVFNSLVFPVFLVALLLGLRIAPTWSLRKTLMVVASYLFYAAWNPPYVALLWVSTAVDWLVGRRIHASRGRARLGWLTVSLGVNLGLLGWFKYGAFLTANLGALTGLDLATPADLRALPVGISFYTFQTLSYSIDVYRGRLAPSSSPLDFALYVAFFPQLVAGPIVRAVDFLPQCREQPHPSASVRAGGVLLLVWGLFQKVFLADLLLAPVADRVFHPSACPGALEAWLGTLAFSGQIYFDFAGYSLAAIGVAQVLGFRLPTNFRAPYGAVGFSDFWRRWHVSLSEWLRDYLYISLGGNRGGTLRTLRNLVLTMALGGLWHGASWTFVAWGLLHGAYLVVERFLRSHLPGGAWLRELGWLGTYLAVCVTWVFFRCESFSQAGTMLLALGGQAPGGVSLLSTTQRLETLALVLLMLLGHRWSRDRTLGETLQALPPAFLALALAVLGFFTFTAPGGGRAFLYFQF